MQTKWQRDILDRAAAAMLERHQTEHRAAVDRRIERDRRMRRAEIGDFLFGLLLTFSIGVMLWLARIS